MKHFFIYMLAVTACVLSTLTPAADLTGTWWGFNAFTLKVPMELPPQPDATKVYMSWQGRGSLLPTAMPSTGDLTLEAKVSYGQTEHAGSMILIHSRAMAIKGPLFTSERDGKPDFGGAVSVSMMAIGSERLVVQVLTAALPQGPDALKGEQAIDYTETKTALPTASPTWKVTGTAKRGADGSINYDLTLTTYAPGHPDVARARQFTGSFSKVTDTDAPDDTSLQGWTLGNIGISSNISDPPGGPKPAWAAYKTVGDVRAALSAEDDPGTPDPKRDFVGYWAADCDHGAGLNVTHTGTEGLYSVVRCGSFCPAHDPGRKTYVNGDRHYHIDGDDLITVYQPSGAHDQYHRCPGPPPPLSH